MSDWMQQRLIWTTVEESEIVADVEDVWIGVNHLEGSLWIEATVVCSKAEHSCLETEERTWQQEMVAEDQSKQKEKHTIFSQILKHSAHHNCQATICNITLCFFDLYCSGAT